MKNNSEIFIVYTTHHNVIDYVSYMSVVPKIKMKKILKNIILGKPLYLEYERQKWFFSGSNKYVLGNPQK